MDQKRFNNLDQFCLLIKNYLQHETKLCDILDDLRINSMIYDVDIIHIMHHPMYAAEFCCKILIQNGEQILATPKLVYTVDPEFTVSYIQYNPLRGKKNDV